MSGYTPPKKQVGSVVEHTAMSVSVRQEENIRIGMPEGRRQVISNFNYIHGKDSRETKTRLTSQSAAWLFFDLPIGEIIATYAGPSCSVCFILYFHGIEGNQPIGQAQKQEQQEQKAKKE